jgi:hypothetical protein
VGLENGHCLRPYQRLRQGDFLHTGGMLGLFSEKMMGELG